MLSSGSFHLDNPCLLLAAKMIPITAIATMNTIKMYVKIFLFLTISYPLSLYMTINYLSDTPFTMVLFIFLIINMMLGILIIKNSFKDSNM